MTRRRVLAPRELEAARKLREIFNAEYVAPTFTLVDPGDTSNAYIVCRTPVTEVVSSISRGIDNRKSVDSSFIRIVSKLIIRNAIHMGLSVLCAFISYNKP
ncbi:membrane protein US8A [Felid alphaherpesvirus 1]|uniref:Membrane protein US8A n=1 Tax=Feline herpesvirus 1 TaxID=10334 RepID=A2SUF0_FHV1|nr:membrane protein US8A [Felid alphaherpesvirus 1]AMN89003.1 membrane protein US8A [synthetic construct]ACT88361.1 membrane protein US8A [Felid alphaherpesvirus 1]ALJ84128.1 membrane protein US8A [Felid alphaherpesvirus 1]ALJ84204.1 membrane protein US8A [Felid alphaherpesvirus 1]ALJ84280.1 membrane protein US8A [Felid alphaherpesvirus 1]